MYKTLRYRLNHPVPGMLYAHCVVRNTSARLAVSDVVAVSSGRNSMYCTFWANSTVMGCYLGGQAPFSEWRGWDLLYRFSEEDRVLQMVLPSVVLYFDTAPALPKINLGRR